MYRIKKFWNPGIFQGTYKKGNYFEGWYYKLLDESENNMLIIIPGISLHDQDAHAFIQVMLSGHKTYYFRYPLSKFYYREDKFAIQIDHNYFSEHEIRMDIRSRELNIAGSIRFLKGITLPKSIYRPSIMGPFSYLSVMECYHDVIQVKGSLTGFMNIQGNKINYNGGCSYIEKDWGSSFPIAYLWLQSNHFRKDASFLLSVARIPFFHSSFCGFLSFLRIKNKCLIFATYTSAKIKHLSYQNHNLMLRIEDLRFRLELNIRYKPGGDIIAPELGSMQRQISETMDGELHLKLSKRNGALLYEDHGSHSGLEIVEWERLASEFNVRI